MTEKDFEQLKVGETAVYKGHAPLGEDFTRGKAYKVAHINIDLGVIGFTDDNEAMRLFRCAQAQDVFCSQEEWDKKWQYVCRKKDIHITDMYTAEIKPATGIKKNYFIDIRAGEMLVYKGEAHVCKGFTANNFYKVAENRNADGIIVIIDDKGGKRSFFHDEAQEKFLRVGWLPYPDVELSCAKPFDWEQRRYEIAKAALQGFCAKPYEDYSERELAEWSVKCADEMIGELKKSATQE